MVNLVFAQYTRSVFTTENSRVFSTALTEINGTTRFFSIKESTTDTLRITSASVDERGETSDYHEQTIISNFDGNFVLSGAFAKSDGGALLIIQNGASTCQIYYVNYAPNGQFSVLGVVPAQFKGAMFRSREVDGRAVMYAKGADLSSPLYRISVNVDNVMDQLLDVVDLDAPSIGGSLFSVNVCHSDFVRNDSGEEFARFKDRIYKRSVSGTFIQQDISLGFGVNSHGANMALTSTGNLALISRSNYAILNQNLIEQSSGVVPNYLPSGTGDGLLFSKDNRMVLFARFDGSGIYDKVTFDNQFNLLSIDGFTSFPWRPYNSFQSGEDIIVLGTKTEPTEKKSIAILKSDDLFSTISDFTEFSVRFKYNNIRAYVGHLGMRFSGPNNTSGFRVNQNGQEKGLIFSTNSLAIGQNNNGSLDGIYSYYTPTDLNEYLPGPVTSPSTNYTMDIFDKYNRGYFVSKEMIDDHVENIANQASNYEIPFGIANWPAHGNNDQANNLAPFVDKNNNQLYEPELGDYPSIYGDFCVLYIYHQNIDSNPAGMESHEYFYSFECDSSTVLKNTIFHTQEVFMRHESAEDLILGSFIDTDIGSPYDDFIGTNVELGLVYSYNGDEWDEDWAGLPGFHDTLSAVGIMYLKGSQVPSDSVDNTYGTGTNQTVNGFGFNDGIVDNEFYTLESSKGAFNDGSGMPSISPTSAAQFYQYLLGNDQFGTPNVHNGVDVRFDYFGTSDPLFYASIGADHGNNFSEESVGNVLGERRMFSGTGKVNVAVGKSVSCTKAYIAATNNETTSPNESVQKLFNIAQQLKDDYAANLGGCDVTFDTYESSVGLDEVQLNVQLFPNPTNGKFTVRADQTINTIRVFDLNGRMVQALEPNNSQIEINLSELKNGFYFVKLVSEVAESTVRVVKN